MGLPGASPYCQQRKIGTGLGSPDGTLQHLASGGLAKSTQGLGVPTGGAVPLCLHAPAAPTERSTEKVAEKSQLRFCEHLLVPSQANITLPSAYSTPKWQLPTFTNGETEARKDENHTTNIQACWIPKFTLCPLVLPPIT